MRPCFAFTPAASADAPDTLAIFDEIGFWGVQAKDFVADLRNVKSKTLNVEINSPGGDVFAGLAIYNALKSSGKEIVVKVMGVAASAASLIAMAGDKIVMPKNTFMMVHNPWSFAVGNADELREQANVLDKIGDSLLQTYVSRTGKSEDEIAPLLAKDTWLTANEALELGFATEVVDEVKANAKFDMARADLPESVKLVFASAGTPVEPEPTDGDDAQDSSVDAFADKVAALAEGSGFAAYAAGWALKHTKIEEVEASIAQAREVKALCGVVKMSNKAEGFIKAGTSLEDVRAALVASLADADESTHVDTTPKSSNQPTTPASQSAVKTADIWAKRRKQ